ncbi:hypothetical protein ACRRTK_007178 [Alexandromys fortis]
MDAPQLNWPLWDICEGAEEVMKSSVSVRFSIESVKVSCIISFGKIPLSHTCVLLKPSLSTNAETIEENTGYRVSHIFSVA